MYHITTLVSLAISVSNFSYRRLCCKCAGSLQEVLGNLAKACLHVLAPLLKLHPTPVHFQTQIQYGTNDGSYSIEVSFGPANGQEGQDLCSVESATLQSLQAIKRKSVNTDF